ncbi:MAG: hypothetical protein K2G33_05415, partial [Duncaniella sp.]|nr:hypothetical protein [Duncaniella sp.]
NVASATKWQTARRFWGQLADGTADVSGDLILYGENTFNASSSKLYFRSRLTGNNGPYIQGISSGGYDKQRIAIFQSNTSSYNHEYFEALTIMPSGNVGINTTTPAYRLDVNGAARVTSLLISSGLVEWDASKNAFKFNGNLYATGDITALGSSAVGGSGSGGGVDTLAQLADVTLSGLSAGHALVYDGSKWTNRSIAAAGLDLSGLAQYLSTNQYLTQPAADARYVTLATEQTITGKKTFTSDCTTVTRQMRVDGASSSFAALPHLMLHIPNVNWAKFVLKNDGTVHLLNGGATDFNSYGHLTASAFVKYGGTSSQYLMADGSVREQVYFRQNCGNIPVEYVDITNYSANASGYANYQSGTYNVGRDGYSEILVNLALNTGSTSALQFRTSYSDSSPLYFRKTIDSNRVSGPWREILYSRQIANGGDVQSMTGNGLFYTPTDGDTQTLVNAPFTGSFLMLSHTCYNQGNDVRRSRMALDGYGRMRLFNDRGTGGTGGVWYDVLTSGNYTSYVNPANFVTALGTNGNYLTWTKNGVTNNITVPYATNTHNIFSNGVIADLNATSLNRNGIYTWGNTAANRPGDYGALFQWSNRDNPTNGTDQHWITQLASVTYGGGLYVRTRTNTEAWRAWEKILTNANYASILDGRYLRLSGGTMANTNIVTNLNADLLDGEHLSGIRGVGYAMQDTIIDASSLDENTWYPVTISLGSDSNQRIEVIVSLNSGTKPSWSTHNSGFSVRVIWDTNGSAWGAVAVSRTIYVASCLWCANGVSPVRGIGQLNSSSDEYVFVRGGGKYRFRTSHGRTPILRTGTYTVNNQSISPTTTEPAEIIRNNAHISDNVASATKWQTARRFWGQLADGTADVNGAMTVNYAGTETGISIYRQEGAGAFIRYYNNNQTTNYFRAGMYGAGYFGISYNSGADAFAVTTSGYVGINTPTPAYPLDVNGAARVRGDMTVTGKIEMNGALINRSGAIELYAPTPYIDFHYGSTTTDYTSRIIESASGRLSITGKLSLGYVNDSYRLAVDSLICSSWLRTTGTAGWYSETYGGGWYMSDTTWLRIHGNKSLYASSGIIRTDGEFQIGDSGNKFRVDAQGNAWVKSIYVGGILLSHDTVNGGLKITGNAYTTGDLTALGVMGGAQSITMLGVNTTNPAYNLDVNGTGRFTGLLNLSSGATHMGARVGNTYINSIDGNLIFQNVDQIRFGGDAWNYAQWAGLKYNHSAKTIYLGIADGNTFATAGTAQTGGKLSLVNCDLVVPQGYKIQLGPITIIYNAATNSIDIQGNVRYTGTLSKA